MPTKSHHKLLLSLWFSASLFSITLSAQPSEEDLAPHIVDYFQSDDAQREIVQNLDIPADREDIYRDHLQKLFSEEGLIDEIALNTAGILASAPNTNLETLQPSFAEVGFAIAENAVSEGLQRLPPAEARLLVAHDLVATNELPPRLCMAAINNALSAAEQTALSIDYQNQLSRQALREYLTLTRRAMQAHYRGSPMPRSISPSQQKIANETFYQRLFEHPHYELLSKVLADPDQYSDAENCWANIETGWIVLETPGVIGDWLIISLIGSL